MADQTKWETNPHADTVDQLGSHGLTNSTSTTGQQESGGRYNWDDDPEEAGNDVLDVPEAGGGLL